jgi:hypothetical protein
MPRWLHATHNCELCLKISCRGSTSASLPERNINNRVKLYASNPTHHYFSFNAGVLQVVRSWPRVVLMQHPSSSTLQRREYNVFCSCALAWLDDSNVLTSTSFDLKGKNNLDKPFGEGGCT